MPLINVMVILVLIGVLLWAVNQFIPMQPAIKKILNICVILFVVLWLLKVFGIFNLNVLV